MLAERTASATQDKADRDRGLAKGVDSKGFSLFVLILICSGNKSEEIGANQNYFTGINVPKITGHVFVCDLENYMECCFGLAFQENLLPVTYIIGCCQRTIARKTPAIFHGMGCWRGIGQESTNF